MLLPPTDDWTEGFLRTDDSWQEEGLCREVGYDLFFNGKGGEGYSEAKQVCAMCPVIEQCLNWAMETKQQWGCWGGTSPVERRAMRRNAA